MDNFIDITQIVYEVSELDKREKLVSILIMNQEVTVLWSSFRGNVLLGSSLPTCVNPSYLLRSFLVITWLMHEY